MAEDTEKKITPHLKESISTSQRRTKMEWTPREEIEFPESLRESKEMPASQPAIGEVSARREVRQSG